MQETWVRYLGWEDPLEKGTATTPVFWPGELHGLYSPWSCKESDMTEGLLLSLPMLVRTLGGKGHKYIINNLFPRSDLLAHVIGYYK